MPYLENDDAPFDIVFAKQGNGVLRIVTIAGTEQKGNQITQTNRQSILLCSVHSPDRV